MAARRLLSSQSLSSVVVVCSRDGLRSLTGAARINRQVCVDCGIPSRIFGAFKGAKRGKVPRQRWHSWHSWQCGLCNLQNLKDARETESLSLRQTCSLFSYSYRRDEAAGGNESVHFLPR